MMLIQSCLGQFGILMGTRFRLGWRSDATTARLPLGATWCGAMAGTLLFGVGARARRLWGVVLAVRLDDTGDRRADPGDPAGAMDRKPRGRSLPAPARASWSRRRRRARRPCCYARNSLAAQFRSAGDGRGALRAPRSPIRSLLAAHRALLPAARRHAGAATSTSRSRSALGEARRLHEPEPRPRRFVDAGGERWRCCPTRAASTAGGVGKDLTGRVTPPC